MRHTLTKSIKGYSVTAVALALRTAGHVLTASSAGRVLTASSAGHVLTASSAGRVDLLAWWVAGRARHHSQVRACGDVPNHAANEAVGQAPARPSQTQ